MIHYKQPISVLVVIYTVESTGSGEAQDIKVLLLERTDHPGYWQSVTGSSEVGESLFETAVREVREETGLDAGLYNLADWQSQNVYEIYPQWRYRYLPDTIHNSEHVFGLQLPDLVAIQLAPREHINSQWLSWRDAAEKVFSPSNREAILQLKGRADANWGSDG